MRILRSASPADLYVKTPERLPPYSSILGASQPPPRVTLRDTVTAPLEQIFNARQNAVLDLPTLRLLGLLK